MAKKAKRQPLKKYSTELCSSSSIDGGLLLIQWIDLRMMLLFSVAMSMMSLKKKERVPLFEKKNSECKEKRQSAKKERGK